MTKSAVTAVEDSAFLTFKWDSNDLFTKTTKKACLRNLKKPTRRVALD